MQLLTWAPALAFRLRGRESEIERIARVAFDAAMKRGKKLCSVEKSNVLEVRSGVDGRGHHFTAGPGPWDYAHWGKPEGLQG